ncbi:hypothetical protein NPIL_371081 [Nephila pilipes]|uniref:Uncharacterized protein n=1 Tax=Nephila pilipes TaxID=299642 RepID=A0A8X6NHZ7_NEPPI|nr:hypothetical protein NPIL_371081 [Nephila pilipes]
MEDRTGYLLPQTDTYLLQQAFFVKKKGLQSLCRTQRIPPKRDVVSADHCVARCACAGAMLAFPLKQHCQLQLNWCIRYVTSRQAVSGNLTMLFRWRPLRTASTGTASALRCEQKCVRDKYWLVFLQTVYKQRWVGSYLARVHQSA